MNVAQKDERFSPFFAFLAIAFGLALVLQIEFDLMAARRDVRNGVCGIFTVPIEIASFPCFFRESAPAESISWTAWGAVPGWKIFGSAVLGLFFLASLVGLGLKYRRGLLGCRKNNFRELDKPDCQNVSLE